MTSSSSSSFPSPLVSTGSAAALPSPGGRRTSQKLETQDVIKFIRSGTLTDDESVRKLVEESYLFGDIIGKGSFGTVRIAVDKKSGEKFACKYMDKRALASGGSSSQSTKPHPQRGVSPAKDERKGLPMLKLQYTNRLLRSETDILQSMDHPNIIKLHKIFENRDGLWLIFELAENGPLSDLIEKKGHFTEAEAIVIFHQILDGLIYIHENGIIHRDIKPQNILITGEEVVKITDFGLSTVIGNYTNTVDTMCGTISYMAPEVIRGQSYGFQADIWSLGVVLYQLLYGCMPFNGSDRQAVTRSIVAGKFTFPQDGSIQVSRNAQDLIKRLLQPKPSDRYSGKEVLLHPWLTNGEENAQSIPTVVDMMRSYNAERKFRKGFHAIIAAGRLARKDQRKYTSSPSEDEKHN